MKIIYLNCLSALLSLSMFASEIIYVSDSVLYTIKNKPFSEFIKYVNHNIINSQYKSDCIGNFPHPLPATILEHVCKWGPNDIEKFKKIDWLLDHGAQITDKAICNVAALEHCDDAKIMQYLLEKGGNSNAFSNDELYDQDTSAIHRAIRHDKLPIIELLITFGANVNSPRAENNNTPLHYAIKHSSNLQIIDILLAHGAQIRAVNRHEENLLHMAAQKRTSAYIKAILKYTNLPLANKKEFYYEDTPLHTAASNFLAEPENIVSLLKYPDIDTEIKNSRNETPLCRAKSCNCKINGQILIRFKTLKHLLSQPIWGDPINHLPIPLQIPEKLFIHKIAYRVVKSEFTSKK